MTVKELIKHLAQYPDDMVVKIFDGADRVEQYEEQFEVHQIHDFVGFTFWSLEEELQWGH